MRGPIAALVFVRRAISPRRIGLPFHAARFEVATKRGNLASYGARRQTLAPRPIAKAAHLSTPGSAQSLYVDG